MGKHWTDRGYNAIQYIGVSNSWVDEVRPAGPGGSMLPFNAPSTTPAAVRLPCCAGASSVAAALGRSLNASVPGMFFRQVTIKNCDNGIFWNWVDRSTMRGAHIWGPCLRTCCRCVHASPGPCGCLACKLRAQGMQLCAVCRAKQKIWQKLWVLATPVVRHPSITACNPLFLILLGALFPPARHSGVKIDVTKPRWPVTAYREALNGHHPISLTESSSNLLEGFNVAAK